MLDPSLLGPGFPKKKTSMCAHLHRRVYVPVMTLISAGALVANKSFILPFASCFHSDVFCCYDPQRDDAHLHAARDHHGDGDLDEQVRLRRSAL